MKAEKHLFTVSFRMAFRCKVRNGTKLLKRLRAAGAQLAEFENTDYVGDEHQMRYLIETCEQLAMNLRRVRATQKKD